MVDPSTPVDVVVDESERSRILAARDAVLGHPAVRGLFRREVRGEMSLLWDDDEVSVGLGTGSRTWPVREIPDTIDWDAFHDVPVGIVLRCL
mgnify:CR=1 FL=1